MWFNFIRDQDMRKTLLTWCYYVTLMENEVRWHLCRGLRGRATLLNVFFPQITRKVYLIQPRISYNIKRNVLGVIILVHFFFGGIQMTNISKDLVLHDFFYSILYSILPTRIICIICFCYKKNLHQIKLFVNIF